MAVPCRSTASTACLLVPYELPCTCEDGSSAAQKLALSAHCFAVRRRLNYRGELNEVPAVDHGLELPLVNKVIISAILLALRTGGKCSR